MYGPPESGGEFLLICLCFIGLIANRYPVVKPDTFGYIGEAIEAARLAPAFLCRQCPLDQAQQGIPRHAVLGPTRAMPNGGKARFDRVGGPNIAFLFNSWKFIYN